MINLIGTYDCKADAKGRVMLPTSLKEQFGNKDKMSFVMKRAVFQPCLELYPLKEWEVLMQKMNRLNPFVKKNNDFIRRFTAGVKPVEVDSAGRIQLPRNLIEFAGIDKNVVLSSAISVVEVWDKERYEKAIEDVSEGFSALAEEVMGDFNQNLENVP